jgi:O-antigen/teichoic acid export membrane protein
MLRSALLVLSGNAAASLLLLARNLIVARLIPVADYGVASTFAVAMAVVEMMSALGLQQQIVQAKNGEDPRFQAALQGFQLLRGVISGTVLLAIAGPMAGFLGIPDATWAYQWLALVPILNGLVHFDIYRLNRQMRFLPLMLTGGVPALLSLLAVGPLAHWFGDWQVMLYAILLQAAVTAITSHLVAERRWQVVFDRAIMAESLRFGWPLLVNGILLFAVFNGEKLIVGRELGMEALAIFAMGVTLTLTPTLVASKSMMSIFLPRLSKTRHNNEKDLEDFSRESELMLYVYACLALAISISYGLVGEVFIHVILGDRYAGLNTLLALMGIIAGIRVLKGGPAIISLASGNARNSMIANSWRLIFILVAWNFVHIYKNIITIIIFAILAEILGALTALWLSRKSLRSGRKINKLYAIIILVLLFMASTKIEKTYFYNYDTLALVLGFIIILVTLLMVAMHRSK